MPVPLYLSEVVDPPEADRLPPLKVRDLRLELEHKLPFFKGLSTIMRRLLTGYALWYNRRHHRNGHLFLSEA